MVVRPRDELKREAIVTSALRLLNERGFEGASVAGIAEEAGVSPATIYTYFENKEDLINRLYLELKREMSTALLRGFSPDAQVETNFRTIWHNLYGYIRDHRDRFRFLEQFANTHWIDRVREEGRAALMPAAHEFLERGRREKKFKAVPDEILMAYAFYPIMRLACLEADGNLKMTAEKLDQAYRLAWESASGDSNDL